MRQGDWDEIVQHPDRPLTRGQVELLREQNIAALNCERRSALCLRLIIEVDRLVFGPLPSAKEVVRPDGCPREGEVEPFDAGWRARAAGLERTTVIVMSPSEYARGWALLGWDAYDHAAGMPS